MTASSLLLSLRHRFNPLPPVGKNSIATTVINCFHCGQPVPATASYRTLIDGSPQPMCCPGCQAVAQAIVDGGLESYYHHRDSLPATPREALPDFIGELKLYDSPEIQQSFVRSTGEREREASLILEGITCAACVWLNQQHLARLPGVLSVEINYTSQRARVRWDDSRIKLSAILQAVAAIGYHAHPFDPDRQEAAYQRRRKTLLWQIFVAGFGMMQVMMYAVPVYLAGDGEMTPDIEQLMRWASLVLTLPVMFYSAAPFFSGAWRDLKNRRAGMDVPVALGIGAAFTASVWATLMASGAVYFDSISMFVFLLLCGRFLELGARAKASAAAEKLVKLLPAMARRLSGYPASRADELVPVSMLKPGDVAMVLPGASIPADGVVLEGNSAADEALLTGESRPVSKAPGNQLTGGAINIVSPLIMKIERVGQETVVAGIVRLLDRALAEKPRLALLADKVAGWFVLALLLVAACVALAWYRIDPAQALWVTVSVLVVTCPCALSLATPAALAAATGSLSRMGLLVTRGHALETLAKATHFVFDKTGTLTCGRMSLQETVALNALPGEQCLAIAAALERGSEHPIAQVFAPYGQTAQVENAATELHNTPGGGMEGVVNGVRYRIGSAQFVMALNRQPFLAEKIAALAQTMGGSSVIVLGSETEWLAAFMLGDSVRPEARDLIARLQGMGKKIILLTGDTLEAAQRIGSTVGIETVIAGKSPAEKLDYVRTLQSHGAVVAMIGDGVNDAPVLAQAQVSIAMGEGTQIAQASADMILLGGNLLRLAQGCSIARKTMRIIRQNLAWAVAYNFIALPLAVTGHVTPWMAGIGMASSSLLVVLNALRLTTARS